MSRFAGTLRFSIPNGALIHHQPRAGGDTPPSSGTRAPHESPTGAFSGGADNDAIVHRHTSFEELTPTLLREFVEKIVVHESTAEDGKRRGKLRRQEIGIYYSFVGKVELPER